MTTQAITQTTTDDRPTDTASLRTWLQEHLDIEVTPKPVVSAHAAPLDYLSHAFFEGSPGAGGSPAPPLDSVVWASRGSGKTFLGAVATALELLYKPGIAVRILGGSMEQSARMHEHLRRLFEKPRLAGEIDGRITERRLRLRNGSTVELLAQSQTSVRGTRVQRLRCDEVELFDPDVWEAAQLVTKSRVCAGRPVRASIECFSTMHVPGGLMSRLVKECDAGKRSLFRWGLVDVLEKCPDERACRPPGGDCPLLPECDSRAKKEGHVGHTGIDDAIRMKGRVSQATWDSEMLCRRPVRRDAVFTEFSAADHVVDGAPWEALQPAAPGDPAPLTWLAGMDFGFRAPTVVLWAALDPAGVLWIVDERHVAGAILRDHIDALRAAPWPTLAWIGADPAGAARSDQTGDSSITVLKAAGFTVRTRNYRVAAGLELIRARLRAASGGPPRLYIHKRCEHLIESMERYRFPADPNATEPLKDGSDHAADALRYLITNLDSPYRTETWQQ